MTNGETDGISRRNFVDLSLVTAFLGAVELYADFLPPYRTDDVVVDATPEGNRDGYRPPEGLHIDRFEPADDRVAFGGEISLEAKLENTTDEPLTFQPPLFIYDRVHDLVVDKPLILFELGPGEMYHQEVEISRATQEGKLWIGWDEDGMRQSIGHITVYHPTETEVDREREP